jgi:hypothetical protein
MMMNTGQESQDRRHDQIGRRGCIGHRGTMVMAAMVDGEELVEAELNQVFSDMGEWMVMAMTDGDDDIIDDDDDDDDDGGGGVDGDGDD